MADEKPLSEIIVGDRFWLGYAQEIVRGAVGAPERRADQLATAIAWFWTIYSAAALVTLTVGNLRLPQLQACIIALPSTLLILAYWMASRVRRPILVDFDPRIPREIENVHAVAAREKRHALKWAERLTTIAAFTVVLALIAAVQGMLPERTELSVRIDPLDPRQLLILGAVSKDSVVRLSAQAIARPGGTATSAVSTLERSDGRGVLHAKIHVEGSWPQRVTVDWTEDKVQRTAALEVKPEN